MLVDLEPMQDAQEALGHSILRVWGTMRLALREGAQDLGTRSFFGIFVRSSVDAPRTCPAMVHASGRAVL
jgi:hypothetical protein